MVFFLRLPPCLRFPFFVSMIPRAPPQRKECVLQEATKFHGHKSSSLLLLDLLLSDSIILHNQAIKKRLKRNGVKSNIKFGALGNENYL
jgi:hypothetical protein